jgi:1-acyl-sn-glycerol-3-phosphate acyltransferase
VGNQVRYPERRGALRRLAANVVRPVSAALTRRDWAGAEHIPTEGGVVIACNHLSVVDPVAVAHFIYDAGRFPRFLAKDGLFHVPVLGSALLGLGQIPVYRGSAKAGEAFRAAIAAVRDGACVVVYPEATVTRDPALWPMTGKTGIARIALETGAPVVPVASWGAQRIWPYGARPRPLPRKAIRVIAGPPVDLSEYRDRTQDAATVHEVTDRVMRAVTALVASLRGEPAPDELYDRERGGLT